MTDGASADPDLVRLGVVPSKLRPPRLRTGGLGRKGLTDELRAATAPLIVVRAPAGFGKSTLVRQWLDLEERPAAWVTLDSGDDDPVSFLRHVVRALDDSVVVPAAWSMVSGAEVGDPSAVLATLGAELSGADPHLLILDDVQLLEGTTSLDLLRRMVGLTPEGSAIVLVGRTTPPVHLERRRLAGEVLEIGVDALQLGDGDAARLVELAAPGAPVPIVRALVKECEGWAAGLALASLALEEGADPDALVAGIASRDGHLARYFHEELLDQLSDGDRDLLLRTAVLDRMTGPLCDQLLDRSGSSSDLERLATSANFFVTGLDDGRVSYRYHHLFQECLLAALRASDPDAERQLRVRAAHLLADNGVADEAIGQAIAAGELQYAAEVLHGAVFSMVETGRIGSLSRWLSMFPAPSCREIPQLALCSGWAALVQGRSADLRHWLEMPALTHAGDASPEDATLETSRNALVMLSGVGGSLATAAAARSIIDSGPTGNPFWAVARLVGTIAEYVMGLLDDPLAAFRSVEFDSRGHPATHVGAMSNLALIEFRANRVESGHRWTVAALELLRASGLEGYSLAGMVHAVHAIDAAQRGEHEESAAAAKQTLVTLGAMSMVIPRAQIHLRLALVEAALESSEPSTAAQLLHEIDGLLGLEPEAVVLRDWTEGARRRAESRSAMLPVDRLSPAEHRVLEQLATHRSQEQIGVELFVSRNTVKSHTLSIYRKLSVSSRSDAVGRAQELGLLRQVRRDS